MQWERPDRSEFTIGGDQPYRVHFAALVAGGVAFWMGTDGIRAKEIKYALDEYSAALHSHKSA
jgi:hypothetical protein